MKITINQSDIRRRERRQLWKDLAFGLALVVIGHVFLYSILTSL